MTALEANGEPRVERSDKGEVIIFPLQVRRLQPLEYEISSLKTHERAILRISMKMVN